MEKATANLLRFFDRQDVNDSTLLSSFNQVYLLGRFNAISSHYKEMLSGGKLSDIENRSLSNAIVQYYENHQLKVNYEYERLLNFTYGSWYPNHPHSVNVYQFFQKEENIRISFDALSKNNSYINHVTWYFNTSRIIRRSLDELKKENIKLDEQMKDHL